jgi:hypothetical protein
MTRMLKVAILVTDEIRRPKNLSNLLDVLFEEVDEVLQFVVEGEGWEPDTEPTEESLMAATVEGVIERMQTGD